MISILCASRTRTENLQRMIASVRLTEYTRSEIIVRVDIDDDAYPPEMDRQYDCIILRGERLVHSDNWNHAAARSTGDILLGVGDDCIFRTDGWDRYLHQCVLTYADRIVMMHGDDGQPHNMGVYNATHPAITRTWYETVGRWTGPWFAADYGDKWIQDIADALGRRVFLPFVTEHMHPVWGKAPYDDVYYANAARLTDENVAQIYLDHESDRLIDTEKLRSRLG